MSLFKKGKRGVWHVDFIYRGRRIQGSTGCTNINQARLIESKMRADAALEYRGIAPPKDAPFIKDFLEGAFLQHVQRHSKAKRTTKFYCDKVGRILKYSPWLTLRLDAIDSVEIEKYAAFRLRSVGPTTTNHELATLRKALRLAEEWKLIRKASKVRLLPGVKGRDFVVSGELEKEYLAKASYPLREAAILILDLGLRPDEAVSLRKADISDCVFVERGKTPNARRTLPLSDRAKKVVQLLVALFPDSEWLFKGNKGKHLTRGALSNAHTKLRDANDWPAEFKLYSFRHTYATRLADSGANQFEIMALMGHSDIRMSSKYIHPESKSLTLAARRKELYDKILRGEEVTADSTTAIPKGFNG